MKVKNQVTVGEVCSWKDCSFSKEGVDFPKRVTRATHLDDRGRKGPLRASPPSGRVENWRVYLRWRVSNPALSIAGWVHISTLDHVSSSRHVNHSIRFSRTVLTCLLRLKVYGSYQLEGLFRYRSI